jgi:hypothetical protein
MFNDARAPNLIAAVTARNEVMKHELFVNIARSSFGYKRPK